MLLAGATPNTTILENTSLGDAHVGFNSTHNAYVTMQNTTADGSIVLPADDTPLFIQDNVYVALNDTDNASVLVSESTLDNTTALTPDSTPIMDPGDAERASMITPTGVQDGAYMAKNTSVSIMPNSFEPAAASARVLSLENTSAVFEVAILVEGTGSMRLRSSDAEDIDNAVLQWYTYCSQYAQNTWRESGHGESPLVLSFDWVQIDDTRLDVFFVGVYPLGLSGVVPKCLSSNETLQTTSITDDICSALTLGGFGDQLISGTNAKLIVRIDKTITALTMHTTHMHLVNSVEISRLSINASFIDIRQLISLQDAGSRSSIFDNQIILLALWCSARYEDRGGSCQSCPIGKFKNTGGSEMCTNCEPGTYQSSQGSVNCNDCSSGFWSVAGWYTCYSIQSYCNPGSYWNFGSCSLCEVGKAKSFSGSDNCGSCTIGKFAANTGQIQCDDCGVGSIAQAWGSSACTPCGQGKFAQSAKTCYDCTDNTYQNLQASNKCFNCPDNTESTGSSIVCTCKSGTFKAVSAPPDQKCEFCPSGFIMDADVSIATDVISCKCPSGTYRQTATSASCTDCPVGRTTSWGTVNFNDLGGNELCFCDKSKGYKVIDGECQLCNGGWYLNSEKICQQCEAGKFRLSTAEGLCEMCIDGEYTSSVGSEICDGCDGNVACDSVELNVPKIMHGETRVIFRHFKDNIPVKTILNSTSPNDWRNGDTVRIYTEGARGLNPIVFVYYSTRWSPINIDPIHKRDNVYIFNVIRPVNYTPEYMSINWQKNDNIRALSSEAYVQTINMQPHFLRKHFGLLSSDDIAAYNADKSIYIPFGVRVVNNEPTHKTDIAYATM